MRIGASSASDLDYVAVYILGGFMITNRVGPPVRGADFSGREAFVKLASDKLKAGHVLLAAPRRFGKTSVMYRLMDDPQWDYRDEFPMMIDRMARSEKHREDAKQMLYWLRALRVRPDLTNVRFLIAGSIGIGRVLNELGAIIRSEDSIGARD
jgi:hypothetical protein